MQVQEAAMLIPICLFIVYNFEQILQYMETGQSIRAWWNNQRMGRVNTMCAWLLGVVDVVLKILGIAETVFQVTKKDTSTSSSSNNNDNDKSTEGNYSGRFTFDESPMFVPGTTILLVQVFAIVLSFIRFIRRSANSEMLVLEGICSVWLVLCFWPFLKGIFGKGRYGLPLPTIYKSATMALLFVLLCRITHPGINY